MSTEPFIARATFMASTAKARPLPWATAVTTFASDLVAVSAVYWLAVVGRYLVSPRYDLSFYLDVFPCFAVLFCGLLAQGLYPGLLLHPAEELRRVFYAVSIFFLLAMSASFLWRNPESYSRSVMLLTWAFSTPAILFLRQLSRRIFCKYHWWGIHAVVFGSGVSVERLIRTLRDENIGVKIKRIVTEEEIFAWAEANEGNPDAVQPEEENGEPCYEYAIVSMPEKSGAELLHAIQDYCHGFRHVLLIPDLPRVSSMGISAREIGGELGLEVPQRLFHRGSGLAKRALDLAVSALAIVLLAPVFLGVGLAIAVHSPGGIFFGHKRYGRRGQTFHALKFRTMAAQADKILAEHLEANPADREEWERDQKLRNDPRITAVGKWLRRYSLDELPQLFNVLAGQMSLVGPRPIVAAEIPKYGRGYALYKRALPGITGLWQVSGRNHTTYAQRVTFDEYYVHNWSVWLDAYILARTVKTVVSGDGAY